MQHHPDKVPEDQREAADIKFKAVSQAYEILHDEDKRHLYDTHGMAAFDNSRGGPGGMHGDVDLDDILAQMFGGGMGGMGGMPGMGGGGRPRKPRRGRDEEQRYPVKLEELYKGKTVKFASTKNVICSHCKGSGGKDGKKPKDCASCKGMGAKIALRQVGPGMVTQEQVECDNCSGTGKVFADKERCKKCKGKCTTSEKKVLELYIPRGAQHGERIVLEGEADQVPDQIPGDIVFVLDEQDHETFQRRGSDLLAKLNITLAESLCGFSRVVLKHLDGRGIKLTHPRGKILKPGEIIRVEGEGMPQKKTDAKGDLYLEVDIEFPENGWTADDAKFESLISALPKPKAAIETDEVDEHDFEEDVDIEEVRYPYSFSHQYTNGSQFGASSGQGGAEWEDDEDDEGPQPQCAQQ